MAARIRSKKFSQEELEVLGDQTEKYSAVLYSENITKTEVEKYWQMIATAITAVHGHQRSAAQVIKKASNIRSQAKKKASHNKKEIVKTGGGESEIQELTQVEEKLLATLPKVSYEGIIGGLDTSAKCTENKGGETGDANIKRLTEPCNRFVPRQSGPSIPSLTSFFSKRNAQEKEDQECVSDASLLSDIDFPPPKLGLVQVTDELPSTSKTPPAIPSHKTQFAGVLPLDDSSPLRNTEEIPIKLRFSSNKRKMNFRENPSFKRAKCELPSVQELMVEQVELLKVQVGYFSQFEKLFCERNKIEKERNEILRNNRESALDFDLT